MAEQTVRDVDLSRFEIHSGPFAENPYPILGRLREEAPVIWHHDLQAFLITRYQDVKRCITDESLFVPDLPVEPTPERRNMIVMNGEEHKKYRRVIQPAFTRSALAQSVEPRLPGYIHPLIDAFEAAGEVDLVPAFANPIPAAVIKGLLEVPELEEREFMHHAQKYLEYLADPHDPDLQATWPEANRYVTDTIYRVIETHRTEPRGGLVTDLLGADVEGKPLTDDEIAAFIGGLIIAGVETTQRLIAIGTWLLCRHPDQYVEVLEDRSLLPRAIEEMLRLHPPNHFRMRYAVQDVEWHGVRIPAGEKVYALTGAANRDPRAFLDPDRFDIRRDPDTPERHLSFGWGVHLCLGAALARMEAFHAFSALFDRVGQVELAPGAQVCFAGFRNRSPVSLPLVFTPRAGSSERRKEHISK